MLLAFLGFGGERTDFGAHITGFVVGAVMGLVLARVGEHVPHGDRAQRVYGVTACGLLALAWLMAVRAA